MERGKKKRKIRTKLKPELRVYQLTGSVIRLDLSFEILHERNNTEANMTDRSAHCSSSSGQRSPAYHNNL